MWVEGGGGHGMMPSVLESATELLQARSCEAGGIVWGPDILPLPWAQWPAMHCHLTRRVIMGQTQRDSEILGDLQVQRTIDRVTGAGTEPWKSSCCTHANQIPLLHA